MMIEKILLPLDGSPFAERALPYALSLASATGARLILMHATVPTVIPRAPIFDVEAFARQIREGQALVPCTSSHGIAIDGISHDIFDDQEAEGISEAVREQGADLIVMATHAHDGLGRWLHGGVANQLLAQSAVPIVLVPPTCDHAWPDIGSLRILVPLDGSRFAEGILEPVGRLATAINASLLLVGASGPLDSGFADGVPSIRTGFGSALHETHEYLDQVAAPLRAAGQRIMVDAEVGRPRAIIESIGQRRHVDLIAMATHGRTGVARMALGSVAADLLDDSKVPLLLWRPVEVRHAEEPAPVSTTTG
jgi:nucleotide-binding universal stress UspA family protein